MNLINMNLAGLSQDQVLEARKKFGENVLPSKKESLWLKIFFDQLKNPLVFIALLVGIISFVLGEYIEAILINVVIAANVLTGFIQEYGAQRTLASLEEILKPQAVVIRENVKKKIEAKEIVPDDLVVLEPGDRIPADGALIQGENLLVNEAILTGEEEAVEKALKGKNNRLFMGTIVLSGRGIMRVEKIGKETEIGKIGLSLSQIEEEKTPLQLKLQKLTRNLALVILGMSIIIFFLGFLKQGNLLKMARFSLVLSVAAMPEGLPIAITVIMAMGMKRITNKNGLVKRLLSLEVLGSTSVICIDKTGTITEGKMQVVKTDFKDEKLALLGIALNNDQKRNLEIALWEYAKSKGIDAQKVFDRYPRIDEESFDSERKYSLTVHQIEKEEIGFLLGAPEIVLGFCRLSQKEKEQILQKMNKWANGGLRVAGLAYKKGQNLKEKGSYLWLGLFGVKDPLRKDAKETIAACQKAGIKIKIVTGDFRATAEKVAQKLGFKISQDNVMEGKELEEISESMLKEKIDDIVLFTRVTPHQKLKIIRVLQEKGEIVAMTGDGVNDAPALKKANIGVVVGNATDVAKEAGDLILLDSSLKTILSACYEGRLIFLNIKKVVNYVLSNSFAEIFLIFGAMFFNLPIPLTIAQILWIHLITDGPPGIVLGFEPFDETMVKEKPLFFKKEELVPGSMKVLIFTISLIAGFYSLFLFWYFYKIEGNIALAQTISFATLASVSLFYIFSFKSLQSLIFKSKIFFRNKYLFLGVAYGFLLVFAAIYLPYFNKILKTIPLNFLHWLSAFSVALMTTALAELFKLLPKPTQKD